MGLRLYVATTYKVEYNSDAHFNWRSDNFIHFLDKMNVEYYLDNAEDNTSNIEINIKQLEEAVDALKENGDDFVLVREEDESWEIDLGAMRRFVEDVKEHGALNGDYAHCAWM